MVGGLCSGTTDMIKLILERQYVDLHESILVGPINLEIEPGEIVACLGPSGAGKTTFLEAVAGIHPMVNASVSVNGEGIQRPCRSIQIAFQDDRLPPWLRAAEVLRMVRPSQFPREDWEDVMIVLMEDLGLTEISRRWVGRLSGGERSRLSLARAIVDPPQLLLLDEPFRNIDLVLREELRTKVRSMVRSKKISAIMISHSIRDAMAMADKVVLLGMRPMNVRQKWPISGVSDGNGLVDEIEQALRDLRPGQADAGGRKTTPTCL